MKKLGLLLFCVCLISCRHTSIYNEFPKTANITFQEIETEPVLAFICEMVLLDSVLITLEMLDNPFIQIFKLPDFTYINGFIYRGRGIQEETYIAPYIRKLSGNSFYYQTIDHLKTYSYNESTKKINLENDIALSNDLNNATQLFIMDRSIYGYDSDWREKEFIGFNLDTEEICAFGPKFPKVGMEITPSQMMFPFTKILAARDDGLRFAALYDKFPLLRIFDNHGNLIHESLFNNNQKSPFAFLQSNANAKEINETTLNYWKIKVTDSYIYGLYAGKTHGELRTQERRVDDFCKEIHVWNWAGEPVLRLLLDKDVFSISISPDDEYILASSVNHNNKIFKINIRSLFES